MGHTKAECFVYGGAKAGQYPSNFRGQKDLHLSPEAHAAGRRKIAIKKAKQKQVGTALEDDLQQSNVMANYGKASEEEVNTVLTQVEDNFAFMMVVDEELADKVKVNEQVMVNAVALNIEVPKDDSINHNTGATRHIF